MNQLMLAATFSAALSFPFFAAEPTLRVKRTPDAVAITATLHDYIDGYYTHKRVPVNARVSRIRSLDVKGHKAIAKMETPGWSDYLTLTKCGGSWHIISVVPQSRGWLG